MTHLDDLSPCTYGGYPECGPVIAVGWLDPRHAFARGVVDPRVRDALAALFDRAWMPISFLGSHACRFCLEAAGVKDLSAADRGRGEFVRGFVNILVPGGRVIYVAPELILHYIDEHGYRPPDSFSDAVLACPTMRSEAYFLALLRAGDERTLDLVVRSAPRAGSADCRRELDAAVRAWRRSPARFWRRILS